MRGMAPLTPEQGRFLLEVGLRSLKAEHGLTKSVIAAIPPDKADYRPDGIMRSAIDLAWHIASAEIRFLEAVASGVFDLAGPARPDSALTPAGVVEWYSERFAQAVDRLQGVSGEDLVKTVDFRGVLHFPAVVYLQVGQSHSVHHRGQLSMYLRPMGAKVPSIYGESFDAREAREKAQAATGPGR